MTLADTPEWLPYDLADQAAGVRFLKLEEAEFAAASFLDGRILTPLSRFQTLSWAEIEAEGVPSRPRHFIFHIGHVGSTLLARLLGAAPTVFSLREPNILRALSAEATPKDPDGAGATLERDLHLVGDLLSRTFHADQTALIKATSFTNALGSRLLGARSGTRAVLMAVSPDIYIAGRLGGANAAAELSALAPGRAERLSRRLGEPLGASGLSPGASAAMSWLCEIGALADMAADLPSACLWLDFETFLKDPSGQFARVLGHFEIALEAASVAAIVNGPLMRRYSKDPRQAYDADLRQAVTDAARRAHREEIRQGMAWLNAIGARSAAARTMMQQAAAGLRHG